jgi:predicted branched-subunit amino acid permease
VDESWAVGHLGGGRFSRGRLIGAGVLVYTGWVAGTVVGVFGAQFLSNPEQLGLDVVSPVLFLALLVGQITNRRSLLAAILGVAIALSMVPLTSPGIPLVAASAACLIGLVRR